MVRAGLDFAVEVEGAIAGGVLSSGGLGFDPGTG